MKTTTVRRSISLFGFFILMAGIMAGCAASGGGEVALVTERPVAVTEDPPEEPAPEPEIVAISPYDTVQARPFDKGKMWTFDNPPLDYFEEAYGFRPDTAWFNKARLGALRFSTYCSASFVSPRGLVMTNHHCARESVEEVSKQGENLLDNGFYAPTLDEERKVPDLYVEQLLAIDDVTDDVYAVGTTMRDDDQLAQARATRANQIQERLTEAAKAEDSTLTVQVISLYNGGKYSAYTFRRYSDVRLVLAPEHQLGYFGGDADNFTYPRYNLDMSFFRVYGQDGTPVHANAYFAWSADGSQPGEAVFVVGNPGTTSRLNTVSSLEFERDYELPDQIKALERRAAIFQEYIDAHPEEAEASDLRSTYLSITNSIKSSKGELQGLSDPYLIARRRAAERQMIEDLSKVDSLAGQAVLFQDLEELQLSKRAVAPQSAAFPFFSTELGSHVLTRALYGWFYHTLRMRGLPANQLEDIREDALQFKDWPAGLEQQLIKLRLEEMQEVLGENDPTMRFLLKGEPLDSVASRLAFQTALTDSAKFTQIFDSGYLSSSDITVEFIEALGPLYFQILDQQQGFNNREDNLNARLARARFALYGTSSPPDASFSLRIADGRVAGYAYNGTVAPPYTTYYGLYNHYHSYPNNVDWQLPERWLDPPETFDLSTPLNLVTTNDITGGNSGSPLLNQDLEVVGLVFDGNIESLPNVYLYRDETARTVSVDSRGMLEALDDIYDADRIVLELRTGQMVASEEEADNLTSSR